MYGYLSIGANLDPEANIGRCLEALLHGFGPIGLYPCTFTPPIDIVSANIFVNTLVILISDLPKPALKERLSAIEIKLGRDRSDPERSFKDRPCDIDIMAYTDELQFDEFDAMEEAYIHAVLNASDSRARVTVLGSPLPDRPATIYLDTRPGHETVFHEELDRLEDRHEAWRNRQ